MSLPGYLRLGDLDPRHDELHRKLFTFTWPIMDVVATTVPTVDTLDTGWAQFYDDETNRRIYVNLNDTIYFWALTAA